MKIASVIGSYNSPKLTKKLYNELKAIPGHDVFVLENSDHPKKSFICEDTIHLGYKNWGAGSFRDFIFSFTPFREYDFVGFWNNDVYNVPEDYIKKISRHMQKDVGIISSVVNDSGTGWRHMRKDPNTATRNVRHVEDIACYFNVSNFKEMCEYVPLPYWGVVDIIISAIYKLNGYRLVIVDETMVNHDLSGARREAGNIDEYLLKFPDELKQWLSQKPKIQKYYDDYISSFSDNPQL